MDMDALHFVFQFPVVIIEAMVAVLLAMRAHYIRGNPTEPVSDPAITLLLALFVAAIAAKQAFWMVNGALAAADLEHAAAIYGRGHWVPIAGNGCIIVFGTAFLSRAGSMFLGRASYWLGSAASVGLLAVGALLLNRGG